MTNDSQSVALGRYGVWADEPIPPRQANELERLGYTTVWVGGSPDADLAVVDPILEATSTLRVVTGVVNIWSADPRIVARSYHRIESAYPGRFLLGIGAGHAEHTPEYANPYSALIRYLDVLDECGVPADRRLLAALGPKVLALAGDRCGGAHPYLVTPAYVGRARQLIGPSPLLAPEQKVVLSTDSDNARAVARDSPWAPHSALQNYLSMNNYRRNLRRMGFTDHDLTQPGSDALVDAVVAHGNAEQISRRLQEHLIAGADHVAIQVLASPDDRISQLTRLATALRPCQPPSGSQTTAPRLEKEF